LFPALAARARYQAGGSGGHDLEKVSAIHSLVGS
jgi:hypothetical protein